MEENIKKKSGFMLDRICEPELMICPDQVKAYAEADFLAGDTSVLSRISEYVSIFGKNIDHKSVIIDFGCGPGNVTELLARRWPCSTVIGIDGSTEMLRVAGEKVKKLGSLKSIKYIKKNVATIKKGAFDTYGSVDLLISNSLLHHIHDPSQFWLTLRRVGSQGAVTFLRDLRRPSSKEEAIMLLNKYLPSAPSVLKRDYLASLHAAFTVEEVEIQLSKAGLDQLQVFEVDDRYLDVIGVL